MFNEDDLTEEENKDLNLKMMNIYSDPIFKDTSINKKIFGDNNYNNFNDILDIKEETKINNYQKNVNDNKSTSTNKKQINNHNNNKISNLNKKTKRY